MPSQYVVAYIVSNVIGLTVLVCAIQKPNAARWIIALIFAYAAVYNTWLGLNRPEEYQGFAPLTWFELYRTFIIGFFKEHASVILPLIGAGQAVIAVTMAVGKRVLWIGALGTIMFLLAIAPLGVGSAFPFSLTVSAAAIFLWKKQAAISRVEKLSSAS